MEMMPYHPTTSRDAREHACSSVTLPSADILADWREGLPVLRGAGCTLRELTAADAGSLVAHLTTEEVSRFVSPPPSSVPAFERFIAWTHAERAAGRYACFAVVPEGATLAVGLLQIRLLEAQAGTAEWGFILGSAYWGTGLFIDSAQRVVDFAFAHMGLHRLEARAAVKNGRGNGALLKLGAVREATLRQSFVRHGERLDQVLWAILRDDWRMRILPRTHSVH
ncbi:MAG: GNAT family N-acetyltransferase [Acidobacteria bacterium]|nr:GNAT family N-acetyltransferase [Acidobacteriota bacterium]